MIPVPEIWMNVAPLLLLLMPLIRDIAPAMWSADARSYRSLIAVFESDKVWGKNLLNTISAFEASA